MSRDYGRGCCSARLVASEQTFWWSAFDQVSITARLSAFAARENTSVLEPISFFDSRIFSFTWANSSSSPLVFSVSNVSNSRNFTRFDYYFICHLSPQSNSLDRRRCVAKQQRTEISVVSEMTEFLNDQSEVSALTQISEFLSLLTVKSHVTRSEHSAAAAGQPRRMGTCSLHRPECWTGEWTDRNFGPHRPLSDDRLALTWCSSDGSSLEWLAGRWVGRSV